jgi:hypothetical protein
LEIDFFNDFCQCLKLLVVIKLNFFAVALCLMTLAHSPRNLSCLEALS